MVLLILIWYISFWYRKMLAKITAKSKKKTRQMFQIVKGRYFRFQNWVYQNVSNEVLSGWFKFQSKIPTRSVVLRKSDLNTSVPTTLLSKDEGLKDIGHNMNIWNLILVVNSVTVSYLICYNSLLQNATDVITKCDSYFITKCDRSLLENASGFLLQNATVLLQNATVITNCDNFVKKCDVYYKLRQYSNLYYYRNIYI